MGASALPVIAVTAGDPGGIGPEITVKALADPGVRGLAGFVVLGPAGALKSAAEKAGITPFWSAGPGVHPARGVTVRDYPAFAGPFGAGPTREGGEASFRFVEDAIAMALCPAGDPDRVDAVVTGPISKKAWDLAGHGKFPGHTELVAERCGSDRYAMMFVGPRLRVVLATVHVPLGAVRGVLTVERVRRAIELGADACARLGVARPRVAVCGLNPHAGEAGLLGDDESRVINPAIAAARGAGIDASGPHPGDTVFNAAVRGEYDLVVAMYHDQGLIPVKLLDRDRSVNITVGLPIIRTSPDHGTAFDIAGRNLADPGSMRAAIELAARMATGRGAGR